MNTLSLPSIAKIGYVKCESLSPQLELKAIAKVPVAIFSEITDIVFSNEPTCKAVSEVDSNGRFQKTTLEFTTTQELPTDEHIAFIIQCVNGKKFLIGTKERPFPVVKISDDTGTRSGNAASSYVEVSHSAIKSLLPIVI